MEYTKYKNVNIYYKFNPDRNIWVIVDTPKGDKRAVHVNAELYSLEDAITIFYDNFQEISRKGN